MAIAFFPSCPPRAPVACISGLSSAECTSSITGNTDAAPNPRAAGWAPEQQEGLTALQRRQHVAWSPPPICPKGFVQQTHHWATTPPAPSLHRAGPQLLASASRPGLECRGRRPARRASRGILEKPDTRSAGYDAFLCHSSSDKPQVRELARLLREQEPARIPRRGRAGAGAPVDGRARGGDREEQGSSHPLRRFWHSAPGPCERCAPSSRNSSAATRPSSRSSCPGPRRRRPSSRSSSASSSGWTSGRISTCRPQSPAGGIRSAQRRSPSTSLPESTQPASAPTPPAFRLWNVPPLPDSYQPRSELEQLRRALMASSARPSPSPGSTRGSRSKGWEASGRRC